MLSFLDVTLLTQQQIQLAGGLLAVVGLTHFLGPGRLRHSAPKQLGAAPRRRRAGGGPRGAAAVGGAAPGRGLGSGRPAAAADRCGQTHRRPEGCVVNESPRRAERISR